MNIRCLLPRTSGAQQFAKSAVRRIPFLVQSMSHPKLNEPRFLQRHSQEPWSQTVKILGFHKALLEQDLISESLKVHIVTFQIEAGIFAIHYCWFTGFTDSWQKNPDSISWERPDTALPSYAPGNRQQSCLKQDAAAVPKALSATRLWAGDGEKAVCMAGLQQQRKD